jgi:hypothetical protein
MSMSFGLGTWPIGVFTAWTSPRQRARIHSTMRRFSPKPGQRNLPFSSVRNQFTWKILGWNLIRAPMSSQWPK